MINRREFLGAAAAATLAGCAASPTKEATAVIPIVDTHQHLWDLGRFRLPWLANGGPLAKNHLEQDYVDAFHGAGIAQAVYMEVDVAADQKVAEAEYVLDLCEKAGSPTKAAVIGGRPADPDFAAYLDRFKGDPRVKGVRQVLFSGGALQPDFVRGIRALGERRLRFDLCMPPKDLLDGAKLTELCPETRFVVDHCGNADPKAWMAAPPEPPQHPKDLWRSGMDALAKRPNVVCKISGIVARVPKSGWGPELLAPVVDACLEAFGPDRVVFGSDWPVCTMGAPGARWVAALRDIVRSRPESEQHRLLHANAESFYSLA